MAEWKKNPKKKKKYQHTKVPTVKLCLDCKQPTTKKTDRCTPCQNIFDGKKRRRSIADAEYERALRRHKHLEVV